jgi:hypothetical protein
MASTLDNSHNHIRTDAKRSPSPVHSPILTIIEEIRRPHSHGTFVELFKPHTPNKIIKILKPNTPNKVIEVLKPIHINSAPHPDVVVLRKHEPQTFPQLLVERSNLEHTEKPHSQHTNRVVPVTVSHEHENSTLHRFDKNDKNNDIKL